MDTKRLTSSSGGFDYVRDVPLAEAAYDRVLPRQVSSGALRGTQRVGYGSTEIDGSNNRITISNPADGTSVGIGSIPGSLTGEFGFFSLDADGNLIMKIVNGTWYVYDITNDKNVMQSGKLPDATYGWAVANAGNNVADGF